MSVVDWSSDTAKINVKAENGRVVIAFASEDGVLEIDMRPNDADALAGKLHESVGRAMAQLFGRAGRKSDEAQAR